MTKRYTPEELLRLRESSLCVKPPNLPPPDEWMGPLVETGRNSTRTGSERSKTQDDSLLDQTNRRPVTERHVSRNSANPEDIILGPPRMAFASATSMRNSSNRTSDSDRPQRDLADRFNPRTRTENSSDHTERNDRLRDTRNTDFRRRGNGDLDTEGWSTVKPRKSFGHEGAERIQQRTGGNDRFSKDSGRAKDRDETDTGRDRQRRPFDKDGDELEPRKNGLNRNRSEPWFKDNNGAEERPSQRERIDRAKSWRERDPESRPVDTHRNNDRNDRGGRGWDRDRDQRNEREPEWLDEPAEEKTGGHTEEDFKKFMESMKSKTTGAKEGERSSASLDAPPPLAAFFESDSKKAQVESTPVTKPGPDRFLEQFASASGEIDNDSARPKAGKSSRFTSFFSAREERPSEIPTPVTAPTSLPISSLFGLASSQPQQQEAQQQQQQMQFPHQGPPQQEKEAFQALLQKLQRQSLEKNASPTPPSAGGYMQPPLHTQEARAKGQIAPQSPGRYQHYRDGSREDARFQGVPQNLLQDVLGSRPSPSNQQPPSRPEQQGQMIQDIIGHRQQAPSQGSGRVESNNTTPNPQTEFLMKLMQSHRNAPEPRRTEEVLMRMPQPQKQVSVPPLHDRELEMELQRERERIPSRPQITSRGSQRLPGLFDEQQFLRSGPGLESDSRGQQQQPTQILQRPPPGLEHHHQMHPSFPAAGVPQMPPQQQQQQQRGPMIPPPGLSNQPSRPMPGNMPGMYPPNFPPGVFPGPDGMNGPPPRNMPMPPPGFFPGPPPPNFMPPPMGYPPAPEGFHFDARGMPPPGANFRRP